MNHLGAIFVQVTTACNGKCVFCPHGETYGMERVYHMSDAVWDKILRDILSWEFDGQVGLYLHGEPLVHEEIYDKIQDINEKTDAHVVLSTNGSLLDEAARMLLILETPPRRIHINVPSGDEREYELLTGLSFSTMVANVRAFLDEADGSIDIEIAALGLPGTDRAKLYDLFPGASIEADYWACSRGGLLEMVSADGHRTRFGEEGCCVQHKQNLCVLWDGSIIACSNDWAGESLGMYPSVMGATLAEIYELTSARRHKLPICGACIEEHGFAHLNDELPVDRAVDG